jgi:hypothetical protein
MTSDDKPARDGPAFLAPLVTLYDPQQQTASSTQQGRDVYCFSFQHALDALYFGMLRAMLPAAISSSRTVNSEVQDTTHT